MTGNPSGMTTIIPRTFTGIFSGQTAYYRPGDNLGYQALAGWAAAIAVLANDEGVSSEGLLRRLLPVALDVSG
jgi:hypothetical protein